MLVILAVDVDLQEGLDRDVEANRLDRRPACRTRRGRTRLHPEVRGGVATGSGAASNGAGGGASAACGGEATTGGGAGG